MEQEEALWALADPTRLKIVELLSRRSYCVGVLAGLLEISAPAVSQHLKTLQSVGLVSGEKCGYHMHYTVNRVLLREIAGELSALAESDPEPCFGRGGRCGEDRARRCRRSEIE